MTIHSSNSRSSWFYLAVFACAVSAASLRAQVVEVQPTPTPAAGAANATATETADSATTSGFVLSDRADTTVQAPMESVDVETAKEATSMVAPAGESLRTTESDEPITTESLASAPTLVFDGNQLLIPSGVTTETAAVNSMADLLKALKIVQPKNLPSPGTREMDEMTTPTELFNQDEVRRLLQAEPTVLYRVVVDATPLPDPMVVPWVRNSIVLKERFEEAIDLLARQQVVQGREALLSIVTDFPDTEYGKQAKDILDRLVALGDSEPTPVTRIAASASPTPFEIQVNPKVKIGSVVTDKDNPENSLVIINSKAYRVGSTIDGFPNHRVFQITDDEVVFEVEAGGQSRQIPVPVRRR